MNALWIPISLLAACLQIARTGLQKSLKADLDDWSVTWVRSGFALAPGGALFFGGGGFRLRRFGFRRGVFDVVRAVGAGAGCGDGDAGGAFLAQKISRSAPRFPKQKRRKLRCSDSCLFDEGVSGLGALGIVLGFCGVLLMMTGGGFARGNLRKFWGRESLTACGLGLGAGFFFALTALFILRAYDALEGGAFGASALALLTVIAMQTAGLGLALLFFRRGAFARMWAVRGRCFSVGLTSVLGSACWFGAFALAHPAYVKTLSQV